MSTSLVLEFDDQETTEKQSVQAIESKNEERFSSEDTEETLPVSRGCTDPILISYCDKIPELCETFISVFEALRLLKEQIKQEDFFLKPDADEQASIICYSYYEIEKFAHGPDFVEDIGFAMIAKDTFMKLMAACPNILSYDREKTNSDEVVFENAQNLFCTMMNASVNYTDVSDPMNLAFHNAGLVVFLVEALNKLKDCTANQYVDETGNLREMTVRGEILKATMGTLYNLSKRLPTRPSFYACNAVETLLSLINDKVNDYAIRALMTLAYLINEDNNNLIMADEGLIKYLIFLIKEATQRYNHRITGFLNIELVEGLAQIAINDSNKKQIVANGAIPVLTNMIKEAVNDEEKIAVANALWVLAFDKENSEIIKSDSNCMELLKELRDCDNEKVKKAASGALWEIEGKRKQSPVKKSGTTNHIMISYQWDVQKTIIKIKDRLQLAGFRVWMDLDQMSGSTLDAMAKAVENSAVVLVCVSQKYKESSNCRSEAEYAFQLKKDIVPLMMEKKYKPDGWLGMIMGCKLWVNFRNHDQEQHLPESSIQTLLKELGWRGKCDEETVQVADVLDAPPHRPKVDISGWTNKDVAIWMKGFGLVIEEKHYQVYEILTGRMLTLLNSFRDEVNPEFYYSSLKDSLGLSNMMEVLLFNHELKKLLG